jgi:hypothetical protein
MVIAISGCSAISAYEMCLQYNVRAILATGLTLAARGVWGGWGVFEAVEAFVTILPRMSGARDDLRKPEKPAYE